MIVRLNDDWRLVSDELQWTVQRRVKGATHGRHAWEGVAYYRDLDAAIVHCARRRIRLLPGAYGPEALEPLCQALDEIKSECLAAARQAPESCHPARQQGDGAETPAGALPPPPAGPPPKTPDIEVSDGPPE